MQPGGAALVSVANKRHACKRDELRNHERKLPEEPSIACVRVCVLVSACMRARVCACLYQRACVSERVRARVLCWGTSAAAAERIGVRVLAEPAANVG
jgi:hypothetical protein